MGHGGGCIKILLNNPIFDGFDEKQLNLILASSHHHIIDYKKEETVFDDKMKDKRMMFLLSGQAVVEQILPDGSSVFLKRLHPGQVFGVLSIFSEDFYPTKVYFEKSGQVLAFEEDDVLKLLGDQTLLKNYLKFFNSQVQYLLNRISLFSIANGEERLTTYLLRLQKTKQSNQLVLPMSKVELADYLGIARSTLYRSIDKLVKEGVIEVEGNHLNIIGGLK